MALADAETQFRGVLSVANHRPTEQLTQGLDITGRIASTKPIPIVLEWPRSTQAIRSVQPEVI